MLQAKRVLAVAPVGGPARGLHVGGAPGLRSHRAQEGPGMEGAGANLHVVRLQDHAALLRPVTLQAEDQLLEGAWRAADFHWTGLFSTPKKRASIRCASAHLRAGQWPHTCCAHAYSWCGP